MRVRLDSGVYSDIASAMEYYVEHAGAEIAAQFYEEFKRCRRLIAERAASFPLIRKGIRRVNFHRFPYHILYQILNDNSVKILIVKHDSRSPDLGLDR